MTADLDRSGTINGFEAILLGTALSLDALGAGISASMLNFSPLLLAVVVGIMCACFVTSGLIFGKLVGKTKWSKSLSFLPGVLLILIGLWKI